MIDMQKLQPFHTGNLGADMQPYAMQAGNAIPGKNPYLWTKWDEDIQPYATQEWWRDPTRYAPHVVYNPYWGYQDYPTIQNLYKQTQGKDFESWPLTQQYEQSGYGASGYGWQPYFPERTSTIKWRQGTPTTPGTPSIPEGGYQMPTYQAPEGGYQPYGTTPGYTMGAPNIRYPNQLGTASDVATRFAMGLPTEMPDIWKQGGQLATQMGQTGMPISQDPWYQQAKQVAQTDITDAIKQAAEQAGLQGLRWSTPLGRTAQDIAGRRMGEFGTEWAGRELGALEAARGRQMAAMPQMYQFGAGGAGLTEAAKERAMGATQQLANLGQLYWQLPTQTAAQSYAMGTGMYGQQQEGLNRMYQDWMRMTPEASPWLQYAMGLIGMPSQMGYQQYQPSGMSQALGAGTSIASIIALLASAFSSVKYKKNIKPVNTNDEEILSEKMLRTPLFNYRYKFEDDEVGFHLGMITELSPDEVTLFDNEMVGLYEYIAALHATIKSLNRRIEKLEEN